MKEELKPCPFCNCSEKDLMIYQNPASGYTKIECQGCGCEQGWQRLRSMAIENWNTRLKEEALCQ